MQLIKITDKHVAIKHFNRLSNHHISGSPYRIIDSTKNISIISNVPPELYTNPKVTKYITPKAKSRTNNGTFIKFLHEYFNYAHNNDPEAYLHHQDGKMFHYNQCIDNALSVSFLLKELSENNGLPITSPICSCFGYIEKKLVPGGVIGNAVICMNNLTVHDWHAWNMVNDFLIDVSITKNGGIQNSPAKEIKWTAAEDHIFKYHPENIVYNGKSFSVREEFIKFTKKLLRNNN